MRLYLELSVQASGFVWSTRDLEGLAVISRGSVDSDAAFSIVFETCKKVTDLGMVDGLDGLEELQSKLALGTNCSYWVRVGKFEPCSSIPPLNRIWTATSLNVLKHLKVDPGSANKGEARVTNG